MGMCVDIAGFAMSRPTGMSDAEHAFGTPAGCRLFEIGDLTLRFIDVKLAIICNEGNACRVIASVFKAFQTLNQYLICFVIADISYNATHGDKK